MGSVSLACQKTKAAIFGNFFLCDNDRKQGIHSHADIQQQGNRDGQQGWRMHSYRFPIALYATQLLRKRCPFSNTNYETG